MTELETFIDKNKMAQIQKLAAIKCFEAIRKEILFYDSIIAETFAKVQELEKTDTSTSSTSSGQKKDEKKEPTKPTK